MTVPAAVAAARACAQTLLFDSLRIDAFRGAVPHILLVVDRTPCVQQKVLVEGYRQILEEFNGNVQDAAVWEAVHEKSLYLPLCPTALTPCGSSGMSCSPAGAAERISYSIVPFQASSFLTDVRQLQTFLRQCGAAGVAAETGAEAPPIEWWSDDVFQQRFHELATYLQPLPPALGVASPPPSAASMNQAASLCGFLRASSAPLRELLGLVLIQRNAFQNELNQYRLRLSLFDMGMRVVEHCHLECMSVAADALAAAGRWSEALEDDQICSYPRSCSLRPSFAESIGKAIADSINLHAWRRPSWEAKAHSEGTGGAAVVCLPTAFALQPPAAFRRCVRDTVVEELLCPGSLVWEEGGGLAPGDDGIPLEENDTLMCEPIVGAGEPLRIVCRDDPTHVLSFTGGMEDCLMNTGHYPAAHEAARNDVHAHRLRFPCDWCGDPAAGGVGAALKAHPMPAPAPAAGLPHGRMKKKDYLAMLKRKGQKPNKQPCTEGVDGDDEHDGITRRRSGHTMSEAAEPAGSRITASIGGTFPVGEVITESFDLSRLNGTCEIFAYPDLSKHVTLSKPVPFLMAIEHGRVTHVDPGAPGEFLDLLSLVRQAEGGECIVRELGIGLNPFTGLSHLLADTTSFERQWGVHLSLGQRHPLFVKQKCRRNPDGSVADNVTVEGPVLKRNAGKYHIDVFVNAAKLCMGNFVLDFTKGIRSLPGSRFSHRHLESSAATGVAVAAASQ